MDSLGNRFVELIFLLHVQHRFPDDQYPTNPSTVTDANFVHSRC